MQALEKICKCGAVVPPKKRPTQFPDTCKACLRKTRWERWRAGLSPKKRKAMNARAHARWAAKNAPALARYAREYRERLQLEMVAAYGGSCAVCGENDPIVLMLDHIHDDGAADREKGSGKGWVFYGKLKAAGWPKGRVALLCHNCNHRKEHNKRKRRHAEQHPKTGQDDARGGP